ncbi:MAG: hypothetical protein ABIG20_01965 [archaeon]
MAISANFGMMMFTVLFIIYLAGIALSIFGKGKDYTKIIIIVFGAISLVIGVMGDVILQGVIIGLVIFSLLLLRGIVESILSLFIGPLATIIPKLKDPTIKKALTNMYVIGVAYMFAVIIVFVSLPTWLQILIIVLIIIIAIILALTAPVWGPAIGAAGGGLAAGAEGVMAGGAEFAEMGELGMGEGEFGQLGQIMTQVAGSRNVPAAGAAAMGAAGAANVTEAANETADLQIAKEGMDEATAKLNALLTSGRPDPETDLSAATDWDRKVADAESKKDKASKDWANHVKATSKIATGKAVSGMKKWMPVMMFLFFTFLALVYFTKSRTVSIFFTLLFAGPCSYLFISGYKMGSKGKMIFSVILLIILIGALVFFWQNSAIQSGLKITIEQNLLGWLNEFLDIITAAFWNFIAMVIPQDIMGVPVQNPMKFRSCYPFCTSPTGEDTGWHGLEITKMALIPAIVYDYQTFSIVVEYTNLGTVEAEFIPPSYPELKESEECVLDISLGSLMNFVEDAGSGNLDALSICTLDDLLRQTKIDPYLAGGCRAEWNETGKCTLKPQDTLRVVWYGLEVKGESNMLDYGDIQQPEIELVIPYKYQPATDLIGQMVVSSLETQVASEEISKIERISNKISESYSPVGPLMLAMGTAEDEVIDGIPTLFMVQFANKGKGEVRDVDDTGRSREWYLDTDGVIKYGDPYKIGIKKENLRLYMPPGFTIMDSKTCDFKIEGKVSGDSASDTSYPTAASGFHPGPGFTNYTVLMPKEDVPSLEKSLNPFETPVLACVLYPPPSSLEAYTFKVRLSEYGYVEKRSVNIQLIGTDLEVVESGEGGSGDDSGSGSDGGSSPGESYLIDSDGDGYSDGLEADWDSNPDSTNSIPEKVSVKTASRNRDDCHGTTYCPSEREINYGGDGNTIDYIEKVKVCGARGGESGCCDEAKMKFTIKTGDGDEIEIGSEWGSSGSSKCVSKEFIPAIEVDWVKGKIVEVRGCGFGNVYSACNYLDDLSYELTRRVVPAKDMETEDGSDSGGDQTYYGCCYAMDSKEYKYYSIIKSTKQSNNICSISGTYKTPAESNSFAPCYGNTGGICGEFSTSEECCEAWCGSKTQSYVATDGYICTCSE